MIDKAEVLAATDLFALAREFTKLDGRGGGRCPLPGHDDKNPSFGVYEGPNGQRWKCHGCQNSGNAIDLVKAVKGMDFKPALEWLAERAGISASPSGKRRSPLGPATDEYVYVDAGGSPLMRVTRHDEPAKTFRQSRWDGKRWIIGLKGVERVLYRLDRLLDPKNRDRPVVIVEGEKDVHSAEGLGLLATTCSGGAGKWHLGEGRYEAALKGRDVVILPDNDDAGRKHTDTVARSLRSVAGSVRVVSLEGLPPKGDLSDWCAAGGDRQQIEGLIEASCEWAETEDTAPWPVLDDCSLHGLAGDFVQTVLPHSEADQVALLTQFLVAAGNLLGPYGYVVAGDRHYPRLFATIVGRTSKGRKGTSWGPVRSIVERTLDEGESITDRIVSGLSSGEGLIWAVRDPIIKSEPIREKKVVIDYQDVVQDPGVDDKRKIVMEGELSSALKVAQREGNTLSAVIRLAYDTGDLNQLVKNNAARSTGAHISIIGHITEAEVRRHVSETDIANGLANRFMWFRVRRSKSLPFGGTVPEERMEAIAKSLAGAVKWAREQGKGEPFEIRFNSKAKKAWVAVYDKLSSGQPGLFGAVTSRGEANVVRMANLYAQLDKSLEIRPEHLLAAIAVWEHAKASAGQIFGDAMGDPVADKILSALSNCDEMTRTDIYAVFGRHKSATEIGPALKSLIELGRVTEHVEKTEGRSRTTYRLAAPAKEAKKAKEAA